jgi:hypothetical protein
MAICDSFAFGYRISMDKDDCVGPINASIHSLRYASTFISNGSVPRGECFIIFEQSSVFHYVTSGGMNERISH